MGPFDGDDPLPHRLSVQASNAMHQDPTVNNVYTEMDNLRATLLNTARAESSGDRAAAVSRLIAARVVRASVVRVIAHRFAMTLAPVAAGLLAGNDTVVRALIDRGHLWPVMGRHAGVTTDWQRVLRGDDARLFTTVALIAHESAVLTLRDVPAGIRAGCLRAGIGLEQAAEAVLTSRGRSVSVADLAG